MNVLVTGANGFVAQPLCRMLVESGATVFGTVRSHSKIRELARGVRPIVLELPDLSPLNTITDSLDGIVHTAARVHQMSDPVANPLDVYRAANTFATQALAEWAVSRNVKRFVFLSSIKVNGEGQNYPNVSRPYTELDPPNPQDPYGISKWEAEQALQRIASESTLETVVLRPTLIYGPNVKANFAQLLSIVHRGIPLPLGQVNNARSMLFVGNLIDAIRICLVDPRAAGQTFLVSDGQDLSTTDLIRGMATSLNRSARLFPFAPSWLEMVGRITGKSSAVQRLLGSLQVDCAKIRQSLEWKPPFAVSQGLQATADWYLAGKSATRTQSRAA